jgi:hypothetical protein
MMSKQKGVYLPRTNPAAKPLDSAQFFRIGNTNAIQECPEDNQYCEIRELEDDQEKSENELW